MRCERCDRVFKDGDTAYEIGVKRIEIQGKRARMYHVDVYVCITCVEIKDGKYV